MMRILKRKRSFALSASILLAACLLLGITYAWMKSSDFVVNSLNAPQFRFDVPAADVFEPPAIPINPGDDPHEKKVSAVNRGDLPGFVRLLVLPTIVASDGLTALPARIGKEVVIHTNADDWASGADDRYYYLKILPAGQSTSELFREVSLAPGLDDRYKNAVLKIEVKCEAVGIGKWDYRVGWWGSEAPPSGAPLIAIDNALQGLAT
jgi:hypothetical protein